jgi:signal transduction histidine kinase/CheY-like chemotaxis protein
MRTPLERLRATWLNLSLARKGIIVSVAPLVTILIAAVPIALNEAERGRTIGAIQRTQVARDNAQAALAQMVMAENNVLGFILTGDTAQYVAFTAASDTALRVLTPDTITADSVVRAMLTAARIRVGAMQAELAREIELARVPGRKPSIASANAMLEQARGNTEKLRHEIQLLITAEEEILKQRTARLELVRHRRNYLAGFVLILGVLGTGFSAVLFTSGVAERVERMQLNATSGMRPDASFHRVAGSDELGQLAVAIEENLQETARTADRLRMAIRAARIEVIELRPNQDQLAVVGSGNVFRRMGYGVDEIPKTVSGFIETIHEDDRARVASALENLTPGWEYVVEFRMDTNGVDWRWMELRGAASPPDMETTARGGDHSPAMRPVTVGVLLDVTERRTAEEQVRRAMTAADRANKAKSDFLSRMSHELRTPLNAVLGFAQLLEIEELTADQRESVSHILRGGRYLLNLINEVLDLARIEAGRLGLSIEPVPIREVMAAVVALIGPQAAEFGVRLYFPPTAANDYARADRQRLQQVLLNLMSNAIKYNRRGGTVELGLEKAGGKLRVLVKDTGPGMSPQHIERLFQPFERLDAAKSGVEGTGLGLALSRTIVEAMGGEIFVESTPGVGSTFTVELDEADVPEDQFEVFVQASSSEDRLTVLYVEDNQANVRLVERVVSRRPRLRLVTISDGDRAIDTVRKERPSLVLLDLNLPGLSGDAILQQLRQDPATSDIPVAILSADATSAQIERLRMLGAQHYLTKPIDVGSLLVVLDALVGDKQYPVDASDA